MKILQMLPCLVLGLTLTGLASAQPISEDATRDKFVSDASFIVGTYKPKKSDHSPIAMAELGNTFLASLTEQQRSKAVHKLDSPERREWTNLPARTDAGGITFGELNESQVKAACDLMAALLSEQGYAKICHIMLADDQLLRNGRARPGFGTETFALVIFSTPSATEPWAFQIDGHHVGVNVAIEADNMTLSPSFIGTQPEVYTINDRKIRPFAGETDEADKLMASLSDEQRKQAIIQPKRGLIRSGPGKDNQVPKAEGVSCKTFSDEQKQILMNLISQWVNDLPKKQAEKRMQELKSQIDEMRFGWHGPTAVRSDISYSIQGPSLIIEYACQDLGGNPLNHLHSNYRDPTNEYGGQLDKK